jgi:hypothetical protein
LKVTKKEDGFLNGTAKISMSMPGDSSIEMPPITDVAQFLRL